MTTQADDRPPQDAPAATLQMQSPLEELKATLRDRRDRSRALGAQDGVEVYEGAIRLAESLHAEVERGPRAGARR
ncbi:MAG: hypothetical protein HY722_09785 [Planctomycetes bacterium]|nr:hypothetical protein [Planctomycetota bacterium]